MAGTWSLLKRMALKKVDELKEPFQKSSLERIDKDLPLGLRFNGIVEIPQVDFILGGRELKITHPGESNTVLSYGTCQIGHSLVRRFYLDSPAGIYVLQIVTDPQSRIEECKLFMPYDEVYPEDWDFWLSNKDGYIGLGLFQTKDGTQYFRVWDNPDTTTVIEQDDQGNQMTRIPPVEFLETVYLDAYGTKTESVTYDSMLYGRHINEQVDEYLLLSAVSEKDGASVQIMVGIELDPASIKAI
jgi:hypothetical protein